MRPAQPWRFEPTLRFLATLPMALAVGGLAIELIARALPSAADSRPTWLVAVGTGLLHATALLLLIPLLRAHGFRWREAFGGFEKGWVRSWLLAAALTVPALAAAWAVHQGCGWALEHLGVPFDNQAAVLAVRNANRWWERDLLFAFAVLSAPAVEEILFRGILWPFARDHGWRTSGALVTALLFALIHFNLAALVPLWLLGLFWTWLYERTSDLTAPMLSHALFNAANFAWIIVVAPPSPS